MTVIPFPEPEDRNPRARPSDPSTSHHAGRHRPNWAAIEAIMLRVYLQGVWENRGFADDEIMDKCGWGMELDGHRRRCSDLRTPKKNTKGVVTRPALTEPVRDRQDQVVKRVSKYSGQPRMVCTLTHIGILWLDQHRPGWRVG